MAFLLLQRSASAAAQEMGSVIFDNMCRNRDHRTVVLYRKCMKATVLLPFWGQSVTPFLLSYTVHLRFHLTLEISLGA